MDHIVADIADFTTLAEVDFGTLAGGTALKNGKLFMLFQLHIHQQATPFYATSAAVAGVMGRAMHLGVYGDDPAAMIHQLYKANPATLFDSQQRLLLPIPLAAAVASATGRAMHLGVYGDDPATVIHRLCKANPAMLYDSRPQCGVSFLPPALPSRVSRESTVTTAVPFPLLFCCCDCCEGC